jgi:hypothetical protein
MQAINLSKSWLWNWKRRSSFRSATEKSDQTTWAQRSLREREDRIGALRNAIASDGIEPRYARTDAELSRLHRTVRPCGARSSGHRMHLVNGPGHVEDRRRRITLFAEYAVAIPMCVGLTHMVFAGKGVFEVARAFVNRSAFRPTTLSLVHTGSHFSLAFDYGTKTNTIVV